MKSFWKTVELQISQRHTLYNTVFHFLTEAVAILSFFSPCKEWALQLRCKGTPGAYRFILFSYSGQSIIFDEKLLPKNVACTFFICWNAVDIKEISSGLARKLCG